MRRRTQAERAGEHQKHGTDSPTSSVCGHCAGIAAPQTRVTSGFSKGATDVESDAPRARLLDLKAAGRYLGVSYWTMRDLVFGGLIPTVKIPCPRANDGRAIRRLLVDRRDLDTFIEKNKEVEQ